MREIPAMGSHKDYTRSVWSAKLPGMNALSCNFAKVFGNIGHMHHVLPHFQREYRWSEHNWRMLWDDAIQTYNALPSVTGNKRAPEHFLGAVVTIPVGTKQGTVPVHRLVDGQQRLTTVSLILCALGTCIEKQAPVLAAQIRALLLNSFIEAELRFKILPTTKNNDRAIYCAIIEGKPVPDGASKTWAAFEFFQRQIEAALAAGHISAEGFFEVLTSAFQVVWVELDKDENAYQIFESLNTKGEKLGEADLVRNYIAMRLPVELQEKVFNEVWSPIESLLDEQRSVGRSGIGELTAFLRHYDAAQTGVLSPRNKTYARFRDSYKLCGTDDFLDGLLHIKRFAALYDGLLRPDKGIHPQLRKSLERLNALDISVAYPFLLAVADSHHGQSLSNDEFVAACDTLENYFVRCFLTNVKSNTYDKVFAALAQKIDWSNFIPSLQANLLAHQFPSDAKIRQIFPTRELYDKSASKDKTVMLLERINSHLYAGSDVKAVLDGGATLEHILPQSLSPWWKTHLGAEAESIARDWKHTIGNLTLVTQSYNSSLSNDSFPEKQAKLQAHGLRLNSFYFAQPLARWDALAIAERADWVIERILEIWPAFEPAKGGSSTGSARKSAPAAVAPKAIVIRDQRLETRTTRDVLRRAAEYVGNSGVNFVFLAGQLPKLIKQTPLGTTTYDWGNGWYMNIHWDAVRTLEYAAALLKAAGVSEEEWSLEY